MFNAAKAERISGQETDSRKRRTRFELPGNPGIRIDERTLGYEEYEAFYDLNAAEIYFASCSKGHRAALSRCRTEDVTDRVGALSSRRGDGFAPRLQRRRPEGSVRSC